jgi:hypothetical protein
MGNQFEDITQNIINAHPESVRLLLKGKGITKPATPEVLKNAYTLFGKPFLAELVTIIHLPKTSSADGSTTLPAAVTAGTEKKDIFDKLAGLFDSVNKVVSTVKGITAPTTYTDPATGRIITAEEKAALDKAADDKQARTMLVIGGLIITTLIIVFVIFKKKS